MVSENDSNTSAPYTVKAEKVDTYLERVYCECGEEMKYSNVELTSNPPQYPHKCLKCEKSKNMRQRYPRVSYKLRVIQPTKT